MARPKVSLLSPEKIADAALELIDENGTFQVLEIARRLNVAPSSLYNHVSGRDEVVELIRERLGDLTLATAPHTDNWRDAVVHMLEFSTDVYGTHLRAMPMLFEQPIRNRRTIEGYDAFASILLSNGFAPRQLPVVISLIDALAIGLAADSTVPDDLWVLPDDAPEDFPALREATDHPLTARDRSVQVRSLAAQSLIAGLEALRHERAAQSPG